MRRTLPLYLLFVFAIWGGISVFIGKTEISQFDGLMRNKLLLIVGAFAIILGLGSLIFHHYMKIRRKARYWQYSIVTLGALIVSTFIGLFAGVRGEGSLPTIFGGTIFVQHEGKLYAVADKQERKMFNENPEKYADIEYAIAPLPDGYSEPLIQDKLLELKSELFSNTEKLAAIQAVSPVSKQPVTLTDGSPLTVYKNNVYVFASKDEYEQFISNPDNYADPQKAAMQLPETMQGELNASDLFQLRQMIYQKINETGPGNENINTLISPVSDSPVEISLGTVLGIYNGNIYAFATQDEYDQFLANPGNYISAARALMQIPANMRDLNRYNASVLRHELSQDRERAIRRGQEITPIISPVSGKPVEFKKHFAIHIQQLYEGILVPCGSTMFAMLAFYMCSAAYRAFRMRNLHSGLLLVSAFLVMLGQIPIVTAFIPGVHEIRQWILDVPNMASKRGIMIGVGLGMAATSFKIIFGIERAWLGGGDE
ncbi:hypothetical protein JW979_04055 [bacterium]|nr:hypothetical protein [candidate division CSSED10-310 bacterium]